MIKRVVLTGGPGSGKTTVIESIKEAYSRKYKVIVIDETASYLINMGLRPFGEGKVPMIDFQELVLKMQLAKENIINRSLDFLPDENVLLIYDRGLLDNCAYINKEEFQTILGRLDTPHTINEFLDRYDLVIDLVSRRDFYTTENNPARSEDVESALELGTKTLEAWVGHKNVKIVYPKEEMSEKINEVLNYMNEILEEKEVKRQEKYVVDLSSSDLTPIHKLSKEKEITQTYLESDEETEKRLRKITMNGVTTYNYTVYKKLEDGRVVKVSDESLSEKLYKKLLEFRDPSRKDIHKKRIYFPYEDEYFTLDLLEDYGILEINVGEEEKVYLPPFLSIIEKVSNDPNYKNRTIAKKDRQYVKK